MRSDTFELEADDGVQIHVFRWLPDDEPKAVVHLSHGLAEHAARYERFATALVAEGYGVYAEDHRGHGVTARTEEEVGHFADDDGFRKVTGDLHRLWDHIGDEHPGKKRVVFAHSMGSTLLQKMLFDHEVTPDAVVLSGSSADPGLLGKVGIRVAKVERMRLGKRGKSQLLHNMAFDPFNKAFKPNRTVNDWLSRDPDEVDKYVADPRCGFVSTTQFWVEHIPAILETFKEENQRQVDPDVPMLLLSGERDMAAKGGSTVKALSAGYTRAGVRSVTSKIYPDGRHEMLNETNRDEVTADIIDWLQGALA